MIYGHAGASPAWVQQVHLHPSDFRNRCITSVQMKNSQENGSLAVKKGDFLCKKWDTFFEFQNEGIAPLPLKRIVHPYSQELGATPAMPLLNFLWKKRKT